MSSVFRSRVRHASKSLCRRPTKRDTASFPSGPPRNNGASAPLSRRVFVPVRYTPTNAASTRAVRRW